MPTRDGDYDDGLDPEGPSAADLDRFGDEYVKCPACGADVYDQAGVCATCGEVLTVTETRTPWWVWVTVALVLMAFALWALL